MEHRVPMLLTSATALVLSGCAHTSPTRGLAEAQREIPNARAFLVGRIPDLTPDKRRLVESTEPTLGHANFTVYYFWWEDGAGNNRFVVESFGPHNFSDARRTAAVAGAPSPAGPIGRHSRPYEVTGSGSP